MRETDAYSRSKTALEYLLNACDIVNNSGSDARDLAFSHSHNFENSKDRQEPEPAHPLTLLKSKGGCCPYHGSFILPPINFLPVEREMHRHSDIKLSPLMSMGTKVAVFIAHYVPPPFLLPEYYFGVPSRLLDPVVVQVLHDIVFESLIITPERDVKLLMAVRTFQ